MAKASNNKTKDPFSSDDPFDTCISLKFSEGPGNIVVTEAPCGHGECRCARGVQLPPRAVTLRAIVVSRSIGAGPSTGSALSARPPAVVNKAFSVT